MKKLLLIIPLLIWVACEDDKQEQNEEEQYSFVNEWVKCKQLGSSSLSSDGQIERTFTWNGNISTASDDVIEYFNEYGFVTKHIPPDSHAIYTVNYIDKWKLDSYVTLSVDGDTLSFENFEWDGLTRTWSYISDGTTFTYTEVYNEFGKLLSSEMISNLGEYSYSEIEYMEDQRRELIQKTTNTLGGELETQFEWIWNGNQCSIIYNGEIYGADLQFDITVNEYFEIINRTLYEGGNFENSYSYEYECPGFEQIYP